MKNTRRNRNYKKKRPKKRSRKTGGKGNNNSLSSIKEFFKILDKANRISVTRLVDKKLFDKQLDKYIDDFADLLSRNVNFSNVYLESIFSKIKKVVNIEELRFSLFCFMAIYKLNDTLNNKIFDDVLRLVFSTIFSEMPSTVFIDNNRVTTIAINTKEMLKEMLEKLKYIDINYKPSYKDYKQILTEYAGGAEGFTKDEFNKLFSNVKGGTEPEQGTTEPECDVCSICLENLEQGQELYTTTCTPVNHKFHKGCVINWFSTNPTCPFCRNHLPEEDRLTNLPQRIGTVMHYQQYSQPVEALGICIGFTGFAMGEIILHSTTNLTIGLSGLMVGDLCFFIGLHFSTRYIRNGMVYVLGNLRNMRYPVVPITEEDVPIAVIDAMERGDENPSEQS